MLYSSKSPQVVRVYLFDTNSIQTLVIAPVAWISGFVFEEKLHLYCLYTNGKMDLMIFESLTAKPQVYPVNTAMDGIITFYCVKIGIRYYMAIQNKAGIVLICAHDKLFNDRGLSRDVVMNTATKTYSIPELGYEKLHVSPDGRISDIAVCTQCNEITGQSVVFYSVPIDLR